MDVVLYRLNISGLTISSVLIALFFAALWRSNRRAELRWWTYGWIANVVALMTTSAFWYFKPPEVFFGAVFAAYLAAKSVYVWMHVRGAYEFMGRWPRLVDARQIVPAIAALSLVAIVLITTRDRLGVVSQLIIAAGFAVGTMSLFRDGPSGSAWLAIAFVARTLLSAAESAAYAVNLSIGAEEGMFTVPANAILAAHYSLDIGVQWLLAMGMVLAIDARKQRELEAANSQMVEAQAGLRQLADRDPLTGLANRRALPEVMRAAQPHGAQLIFFDLNDFKKINDEHGHQTGDECLARFAAALTQCFRPSDAIVRYGGDEFVVVAAGLTETAAYERADSVRSRVGSPGGGLLPIRFAVGIGRLEAGGNPEDALRQADEAMYRAKRKRSPARNRVEAETPHLPLT
ncbi:MAG TPA: GGDEF domain-containing protein [Vicinamibacterales bacterium]